MKKKVMLKEKLLRVSIGLIALFTATIFFVTNRNVNNLVEQNISAKLDYISSLGMEIIKSTYAGDWNIKNGKLFLGENLVNNNFEALDAIKEKTGSLTTLYLGDESVATSAQDKNGEKILVSRVSSEVAESVLKNGETYEGTENIQDEAYAAKYLPIKDKMGQVIGIWFVGIPKSDVESQGGKIFEMMASIVVISILCGIIGCVILVLYSKKYLKDIDTLKVSFLGSNSNSKNAQQKVLTMSLLLIGTFIVIWVTIQGFTIGSVVNKIVDNNIKDKLNTNSELGYMLIDQKYKGDWSFFDNKLYKGTTPLNDNSMIVDTIGSNTESRSTIFMNDTRISTNVLKTDGTRAIGTKASDDVIEAVLKQGKEFTGEALDVDKKCITKYTPLKDSNGEIIGMWFIGVDKKFISNQIVGLRRPITQLSILAIIIAFITFLILSRRMVSDVENFDVRLSA